LASFAWNASRGGDWAIRRPEGVSTPLVDPNNLVQLVYRRKVTDRPAFIADGFSAYDAEGLNRNPVHGEI
jgi:hypothetical protein